MSRPGYLSDYPIKKARPVPGHVLDTLVRQAARWSTAAQQDENSMIAVLHAYYGAGYLWALQDIATSSEIEKAVGIDWKKFKSEIVGVQDVATKKMAKLCPKWAPDPTYLSKIGGEG
jgi:hypothetical protein